MKFSARTTIECGSAGGIRDVYTDDRMWKCGVCGESLVVKKATFSYLGNNVTHEVSRCPKCGKVFVPMGLAEGRMAEVEQQFEDK